jgi:hypothetical protein
MSNKIGFALIAIRDVTQIALVWHTAINMNKELNAFFKVFG